MSLTLTVHGTDGSPTGSVDLPADYFNTPLNIPLIHQVVVAQLGAARQGTHSVQTRDDVRGGGAKPYRQKGTGRARQGSIRSPQFVGGGVVHGPSPRSYKQRTPKKMKAAALRSALSDRVRNSQMWVVAPFVESDKPSTKAARATLNAIFKQTDIGQVPNQLLVVLANDDDQGWYSFRNLPQVHLVTADQLNTYDVVRSQAIVFTRPALESFIKDRTLSHVESHSLTVDTDIPQGVNA